MSASVKIVAEVTNNHLGDSDRLSRIVDLVVESGADFIKIQKRDVGSFYSEKKLRSPYVSPFGSTFRDYREGVELNESEIEAFSRRCERAGIPWFASVLDSSSLQCILGFGPALLKIPSTISEHREFHEEVAERYQGDLVVSTGSTDMTYLPYVLDRFRKNKKIYLLQCTSAYPTLPHDCNVGVVRRYRDVSKDCPRIVPGYSSHDDGSLASMLAVAAGAKMIEKHVKLGTTPWVHFDRVASDLLNGSFRQFVLDIRKAELIVGSDEKKISCRETHKYPRSEPSGRTC